MCYLAFLILSSFNYNIQYISFNIKTLTFIYYIISYVIKRNCNQYQKIIYTTFFKKTYKNIANLDIYCDIARSVIKIVDIDKFML